MQPPLKKPSYAFRLHILHFLFYNSVYKYPNFIKNILYIDFLVLISNFADI